MGVAKVAAPPLGGSTKLVIQLTSIQTSHDSKLRNLEKCGSQARKVLSLPLGLKMAEGVFENSNFATFLRA